MAGRPDEAVLRARFLFSDYLIGSLTEPWKWFGFRRGSLRAEQGALCVRWLQ